jgi:hypothetical protein
MTVCGERLDRHGRAIARIDHGLWPAGIAATSLPWAAMAAAERRRFCIKNGGYR